ncbi:DUF488 family protein [Bartonella sp. DGB2]|uniref:DUF488 domain-containing protein n=1 Tax=Bartonella sp. DGB2 TaxID=3388426 RepID=UPI00398FE56F
MKITAADHTVADTCLFTIGYEGISLATYLNHLIENNVRTLVDVRRNPISRKKGFSKKALSAAVEDVRIAYVHLPELGIASQKRQALKTPEDYVNLLEAYERDLLANHTATIDVLWDRLQRDQRIALTCFECDASFCHRSRIAKVLTDRPDWVYGIKHI